MTPEIYMRKFRKGAFTNPDAGDARRRARRSCNEAADIVRELGADYLKVWPGQDGWDYPFQVDHGSSGSWPWPACASSRWPTPTSRSSSSTSRASRATRCSGTPPPRPSLGIQAMGVDNVGVLLDFGHALFGGESPAAAAQLLIDHGLLCGMDVNDNLRGWDDDMVVGTVHPVEVFEFFYTLKINNWEGRLAARPVPVPRGHRGGGATCRSGSSRRMHRALDELDIDALREAQARQDAIGAQKLVQDVLFSCMRSLTHERQEDLVPHVDARAVPADTLPVLGRVPGAAPTRDAVVAHLRRGGPAGAPPRHPDGPRGRASGTSAASSRSSTSW